MHLEQFSARTIDLIFEAKKRWPKITLVGYVKNKDGELRKPLRRLSFSEWEKYGFKTFGYNGFIYAFPFAIALMPDFDTAFWRVLYLSIEADLKSFHLHDKRVLV